MSDGMKLEAKLAGLGKTFGRIAGGGSLFQLTYSNETQHDGFISCTPDYPGRVVPVHMESRGPPKPAKEAAPSRRRRRVIPARQRE